MSPKVSDEHKQRRKQQILEAAERVFTRKGYEETTLKDIVEEAKMSRGWIYLYFQTKEEIFEALIEKFDEENTKERNDQLKHASTIWEAILADLNRHKMDLAAPSKSIVPAIYEYFISGWRDKRRRNLLASRYEKLPAFAQLLQKGVERGEFVPALPVELIAKIISSHIDGILTHTLAVGPERADSAGQMDALIAYIKLLLGVKT